MEDDGTATRVHLEAGRAIYCRESNTRRIGVRERYGLGNAS